MITAKITKPEGYRCAPEGAVVRTFACGEIVTGRAAEFALSDKAAQRLPDPREETKVTPPPEMPGVTAPETKRRSRRK